MNKTVKENQISSHACAVVRVRALNQDTFQVELRSLEGAALMYQAGQYLQLEIDVYGDGQIHLLSYSIASRFNPENPDYLQLIIQKNSEFSGKALDRLHKLNSSGNLLNIRLPMGSAYLQTNLNLSHLLVAAGSGISKIKCITEEILQKKPDANINIYWSNRCINDFFLLSQFQNLASQYRNLNFTPVLESAATNWAGKSGFIYQAIQESFSHLNGVQAYLCGSPQMVYGTIDKLTQLGLKEEDCYSDVFEFAPREKKIAI